MAFLTGVYTVLIVFLNVDHDVSTNLIDPSQPIDLTPDEISKRVWGSKTVLLVEQSMCAIQWGCKGCMLILYWRLTQNLRQNMAVKLVACYVVITYCVMFILYFGVWCRPFSDYWKVPTNNTQCTTALNHLIDNLVFNLSSDVMIMAIPLPLLLRQRLAWKKKLLMVLPFSLGFFTMVCAILSKYSSFRDPYSVDWVYWYCREASTTMIVSNIPYAWGLLRKIFNLRSFLHDSNQDTIQDGQTIEGRSVAYTEGDNPAATSSRKRSWLKKLPISTTSKNDRSAPQQMISRARSDLSPEPVGQEIKRDPNEAPSSDNSFAGSIRKPPRANTANYAVDRLYNLEDMDDEHLRDEEHTLQRGYDG